MASIEKSESGRFVVRDGDRVYGTYRTEEMASFRLRQLLTSRRPKREPVPNAAAK